MARHEIIDGSTQPERIPSAALAEAYYQRLVENTDQFLSEREAELRNSIDTLARSRIAEAVGDMGIDGDQANVGVNLRNGIVSEDVFGPLRSLEWIIGEGFDRPANDVVVEKSLFYRFSGGTFAGSIRWPYLPPHVRGSHNETHPVRFWFKAVLGQNDGEVWHARPNYHNSQDTNPLNAAYAVAGWEGFQPALRIGDRLIPHTKPLNQALLSRMPDGNWSLNANFGLQRGWRRLSALGEDPTFWTDTEETGRNYNDAMRLVHLFGIEQEMLDEFTDERFGKMISSVWSRASGKSNS